MGISGKNFPSDLRLNSWKEIAAFFDCDERTVRRWEKERRLPVHRLPGGAGGKVFAFTDELEQWLKLGKATAQEAVGEMLPDAAMTATPQQFRKPDSSTLRRWLLVLPATCLLLVLWLVTSNHRHADAISKTERNAPTKPIALVSVHRPDPEAQELYLKGRYYWNRRTPESLNKALDYFNQAIRKDPGHAQAYVGLADCYNLLPEYSLMPAREGYSRALEAAHKAVELDDQSSEAHASLAFAAFYGSWDIATADREFRRAIALNPGNAVAHHWYATYLETVRRFSESLAEIERAQTLDPSAASILADRGSILAASGQREAAIALLRQMEQTDPKFLSPHRYLKLIYLDTADYPNYLAEARQEARLLKDSRTMAILAAAEKGYATGGGAGLLRGMLAAQKRYYRDGKLSPAEVAVTYALLGEREEAMNYLRMAYDAHEESVIYAANIPGRNNLHGDPAYQQLLARIGLPTS